MPPALRRLGLRALPLLSLALLALACAAGDGSPAMLDAGLPGVRLTRPLASLAEGPGLAPGEDFAVRELGRDRHTSHHQVWIRHGEAPHRHDRHDLTVLVVRGHGRMLLGEGPERAVGEGSLLYVPRGTLHAFTNESGAPALAYAIYSPPFDGRDRVLVPAP